MISLLVIFIFSFFTAYLFFPQLIKFLNSKKLIDKPDKRKIHNRPKPSMGGVLFLPVALVGLLFFYNGGDLLAKDFYLIFSCFLVLCLGFLDDVMNLRARHKLLFFFPAIMIAIFGAGIKLTSFHGLFWIGDISHFSGVILTVFTIVSITNAYNLIDGIDGLAACIGIIACSILGILLYFQGFHLHAMLLWGIAGATLAFLFFNWAPSKIFMGDTGSLLLGFLITVSLIRFIENNHASSAQFLVFKNPISFAISLIVLPFFDTIRVFTIRILNGRSPFDPDKNHMHHLLLKLGFDHALTSTILVCSTLCFMSLAVAFSNWSDNSYFYWMFLMGGCASIYLHYLSHSYSYSKKRQLVQLRKQDKQVSEERVYSELNTEKVVAP